MKLLQLCRSTATTSGTDSMNVSTFVTANWLDVPRRRSLSPGRDIAFFASEPRNAANALHTCHVAVTRQTPLESALPRRLRLSLCHVGCAHRDTLKSSPRGGSLKEGGRLLVGPSVTVVIAWVAKSRVGLIKRNAHRSGDEDARVEVDVVPATGQCHHV